MSGLPESRDEAREKALATFMEYFRTNYPGPDTIICKPDWHAPKIFRAVEAALAASRSESEKPVDMALVDAARRYNFLKQHHLGALLALFDTTDTSDVGLDFAVDQEIWRCQW
jgi:hypothetical protein